MPKIKIPNIIPGRKYRMIVEGIGSSGDKIILPSIDFTAPKAPPAAHSHRLEIVKIEDTNSAGVSDRTLSITKYKVETVGSDRVITIKTGAVNTKHKVKVGDKIKVSISSIANAGVEYKVTKTPQPNLIQYKRSGTAVIGWTTPTGSQTVTHVKGNAAAIAKKIKVKITIPKQIINSLIWTDTVKDYVHIVYRSAKTSNQITGKRKTLSGTEIDINTLPFSALSSTEITTFFDTIPNGQPSVTTWTIPDKTKFYKFEFIIVRYIKIITNPTAGTYEWIGNWIEDGKALDKKFSKPIGGNY